jgi:GR25 family glycosyltransferase involved in LPS biosynthesis
MKISSYFKNIVYINLDHRTDRKQEFENEMVSMGVTNYTRVPGTLPVMQEGIAEGRARHIACGTTHIEIVKQAKEKNLDNILIFEDDVCLYNDGDKPGIEIIESALDDLSKIDDWDIFYLSGIIIDSSLNLVTPNLIKPRTVLTTHAYAINKQAYDKVLRYNPQLDSAIDGWYGQQSIDNIEIGTLFTKYVVYPLSVHQRISLSDCDVNAEGKASMGHGLGPYYDSYSKSIIKHF